MAGIDAFTKLMLHCDGADESTTFTDSSDSANNVSALGSCQIDTAQSVFGGASGLFNGSNASLSIDDSDDWAFGTGDWTIDFRIRFNTIAQNDLWFSVYDDGGANRWLVSFNASGRLDHYVTASSSVINYYYTGSSFVTTDTWYHMAFVRSGNDFFIFKDGVAASLTAGTAQTSATNYPNISSVFRIGKQSGSFFLDGWVDEFRVSKGIARWTENFTPPSEAYSSSGEVFSVDESVVVNDVDLEDITIQYNESVVVNAIEQSLQNNFVSINETVVVNDTNLEIAYTNEVFSINESVIVNEAITEDVSVQINESVVANESVSSSVPQGTATYGSKIISINPLVFVSYSSPAKITSVDVSVPAAITWSAVEIAGLDYAQSVVYNSTTGYLYVSGASGKVAKIELANLANQTIINLSDTDNCDLIELNTLHSLIFTSTDSSSSEIYSIDERETSIIDNKLTYLQNIETIIDNQFNFTEASIMDNKFAYLQTNETVMDNKFAWLEDSVNDITPITQEDWHVYIDDVELTAEDLKLDSISITHAIDTKSSASFQLNRHHDKLNTTLSGSTVIITNQNTVKIYIKGVLEFNGKVSRINPIYDTNNEAITVNALADEASNDRKTVNIPHSGLTEDRTLYHIITCSPDIDNPYIADDEENPQYYKGISVSLGSKIEQNVTRYTSFYSVHEDFLAGTLELKQNWDYFWFTR